MLAPHSDLYSAWYDASDASTVTFDGSNLVSQWSDKSGNGHDAVQDTAGLQPRYSAAANGIKFRDSTNNYLDIASSIPSVYAFLALSQGFRQPDFDAAIGRQSGTLEGALRRQGVDEYRASGGHQDVNDYTYPDGRIWINGSESRFFPQPAVVHVVTLESPTTRFTNRIGTSVIIARSFKGWFHEAIFVDSALTDDQIAAVTDYLVGRWTLPAAVASSRPVLSSPYLIGSL